MIKFRKIPTIFLICLVLSTSIIVVVSYQYYGTHRLESISYRDDFNFIFGFGAAGADFTDELDTFKGTYGQDMVVDPPRTIRLVLNRAEMDNVFLLKS